MGKSKDAAQKTLDERGKIELELLEDEVICISERLKVAEQVTKAILSKIRRIKKMESS